MDLQELIETPTKQYDCGCLIAPFQPLHNGYVFVIEEMVKQCSSIVLCVENSPDVRTPWTFNQRKAMIHTVFGEAIRVVSINFKKVTVKDSWRTKFVNFHDILDAMRPSSPDALFSMFHSDIDCFGDLIEVVQVPRIFKEVDEREINRHKAHLYVPDQIKHMVQL